MKTTPILILACVLSLTYCFGLEQKLNQMSAQQVISPDSANAQQNPLTHTQANLNYDNKSEAEDDELEQQLFVIGFIFFWFLMLGLIISKARQRTCQGRANNRRRGRVLNNQNSNKCLNLEHLNEDQISDIKAKIQAHKSEIRRLQILADQIDNKRMYKNGRSHNNHSPYYCSGGHQGQNRGIPIGRPLIRENSSGYGSQYPSL